MSGTSLDGVDGVLAAISDASLDVVACASNSFEADFRAELLALNSASHDELHRAALAGNRIANRYADVVGQLLQQARNQGIDVTQIRAIGAHGQTVRHQPRLGTESGYSLQLNNPSLLAERTGIDVVADFRSRDVAAGGQGAPLVPAFHRSLFGRAGEAVVVLNLGGIANLSVLPADPSRPVLGFDCGPGNALLDTWCQQQTGQAFDEGGSWAASGRLVPQLLQCLLNEPYLLLTPPKSTGRDLFSLSWLDRQLAPFATERPQDIQNTLTEFTARVCAENVRLHAATSAKLIVCGGGAFNRHLMQRLQDLLPGVQVTASSQYGLAPLQVEAAAFAWLARQTMLRRPGNLPSVTGAAGPRVLGAIYPA